MLQSDVLTVDQALRQPTPVAPAPETRYIHLLYAPTNFCNMGCSYCYLGTGTDAPPLKRSPLLTLQRCVSEMLDSGIMPFNLSFHGGEPTAIPASALEELLAYADKYYNQQGAVFAAAGYPRNPLHIKTNLYNFHHLYELFCRYQVSISGSVDLPLHLHGKLRTDKRGQSTLARIEQNLRLLAEYPHNRKISCVVTRANLEYLDDFVRDIRYIHDEIGLDMSRFNVMFSFDSVRNDEKFGAGHTPEMLSEEEQLLFYRHIRDAFIGTELEPGLKQHWFKEFTPDFCCSAVNCGEKFFLLQENGDIYSCPRGQSSPQFRYGNIYERPVAEIIQAGASTIESLENRLGLHPDCASCEFVHYCNAGCTFVRQEASKKKSYTCSLQKELYREDPERYPPLAPAAVAMHVRALRYQNDIAGIGAEDQEPSARTYVTPELDAEENALAELIQADATLQQLYSSSLFAAAVDGVGYEMNSPILSNRSEIALIRHDSTVKLKVRSDALSLSCDEPVNNHLHLMLLRNTLVSYGDEKRSKQEHIADYSIYQRSFEFCATGPVGNYFEFDLGPWLAQHAPLFQEEVRNLLYVTTRSLREYHYRKQQKNAFYHIQAINLPFPHLEFFWQ